MPFAIDEKSSALERVCVMKPITKSLYRASCAGLLPFKDGKFSAQEVFVWLCEKVEAKTMLHGDRSVWLVAAEWDRCHAHTDESVGACVKLE